MVDDRMSSHMCVCVRDAVYEALMGQVAKLPPETLVYCGHEVSEREQSHSLFH